MDQKVTPDILSLVSQTIIDYSENVSPEFTNKDIYTSQEFLKTVSNFFGKPDYATGEMENEYNKFVGQQLKMLSYSGLLLEDTSKRPFIYSIKNKVIIELLAQSDKKALLFLQAYIEKCLLDSNFHSIHEFISKKSKTSEDFTSVRDDFVEFENQHTSINGQYEPKRILAKVLNPLALLNNSQGALHGRLSHEKIRMLDLMYSGDNSQDAKKSKSISRAEYRKQGNEYTLRYRINKAIRAVKNYNIKFNNELSETGSQEIATQGHHIFPKSDYPDFQAYCENIIMLSPNEHLLMAHNNNRTSTINLEYQHKLLEYKKMTIKDATINHPDESPYDYELFKSMGESIIS